MAFDSRFSSRQGSGTPMTEMNMIPLIDVMLVLLVIFIVTAPLIGQAVKIDLPKADSSAGIQVPAKMAVSISADGTRHIDGKTVSREESRALFAAAAQKNRCLKSISMQTGIPITSPLPRHCQMPVSQD